MTEVIERARTAERILIPKGKAAQACISAFQEATNIEVPTFFDRNYCMVSAGRTFWSLKGMDIPKLIAEDWADTGITGTDATAEAQKDYRFRAQRVGSPMCRFSVLAEEGKAYFVDRYMNQDTRRVRNPLIIPTSRPWLLTMIAATQDLPLAPGLVLDGSQEAAASLTGSGIVADLVDSGETAAANRLTEAFKLCDIYPELLVGDSK